MILIAISILPCCKDAPLRAKMGKVVVIALNNGQLVALTCVLCWRSSGEIVAQVRQLAFVNSFELRVMAASARHVATRQFVKTL